MTVTKHRIHLKARAIAVLAVAVVVAIILTIIGCSGRKRDVNITGSSLTYYIDEVEYTFNNEPFLCDNAIYLPAEDIFTAYGYSCIVNEETDEVTVSNEDKTVYVQVDSNELRDGDGKYTFKLPVMKRGGIVYIPSEMMSHFTKDIFNFNGSFKFVQRPYRDLMEDTYIDDTYRLKGKVKTYNNVSMVDDKYAMETLVCTDENCLSYANVINSLAKALPEVKVYNVVVPSMSEFYGPDKLYKDQISGIRKIYENLDESVMPVNVIKEMWPHADEHLYFATDHHWTQRGAYYAYRAFIAAKGEEIADINEFPQDNVENYVGSWKNFMSGTQGAALLENNPETLERFLPIVDYSGMVYLDSKLTEEWQESEVVDLDNEQYTTFLGGDMPIIKYTTEIKNGEKAVIVKESFGNAFSTWAINNYEEVYIIDPRQWNGFNPSSDRGEFNLKTFYDEVCQFDDLIVISYPGSTTSGMRNAISKLVN